MSAPILAVDLGVATSAAAIVADGRTALLRDPHTGAYAWPSGMLLADDRWLAGTAAERRRRAVPRRYVDGPRRALDGRVPLRLEHLELTGAEALAGYLDVMAAEARRVYGAPIPRLVLTAPSRYAVLDPRRDELIGVGTAAGFADVELVDAAVAVALDPAAGADLPAESYVLVCDLGVSWAVACVHRRGDRSVTLARHTAPGGGKLDDLLLEDLRDRGRGWLGPLLGAPGDAGLRARHEAAELVRRLKHGLADDAGAHDRMTPVTPAVALTRDRLAELAAPVLAGLTAACHDVVRDAGVTLADIGAVLLAGGSARLPGVADALTGSLGQPPRAAPDPQLAAVRGAARWAAGAADRVVPAAVPRWLVEPVVWDVPGGAARLLRWTVRPGEAYPRGAVLAEIRTADDLVLGLTAPAAGGLLGPLPAPGAVVGPVLAVAARRPPAAAGPPPLLRTHEVAGSHLLSADRHVLLECAGDGRSVRSWAAAGGQLLGTFAPEQAETSGGRLFVHPEGGPALVAWDPDAGIAVWDVQSGKLGTRIRDAAGARRVLVDEVAWQVAVEAPARYRRTAVTVWDLDTGALVERVSDGGWAQRHPRFRARSAADGFTGAAVSPDGGLRAVATAETVLLFDVPSGHEVFRAPAAGEARVAFEGDGALLLVATERDGRSRVDVHQV
jgi:molecular chaperone DnaK